MAQKLTNTAPNRYPGIFRTMRARLAETRGPDLGGGDLRILSFGCSAGFEMLSLRSYFPDASIFGCDRSADALDRAKRNLREDAGIASYLAKMTAEQLAVLDDPANYRGAAKQRTLELCAQWEQQLAAWENMRS